MTDGATLVPSHSPPFVQRALRMPAAVRQVDLVDRHVDVAQRAFDGVHVAISLVAGGVGLGCQRENWQCRTSLLMSRF
jgi:hypothetical protein